MLRCSQWWVKEQARQRRIPYCWIGGGYRFTPEHVAEIARLFEVRPVADRAPGQAPRRVDSTAAAPGVVVLRPRPPRRLRKAGTSSSAAA
jgi:hypothetical protein